MSRTQRPKPNPLVGRSASSDAVRSSHAARKAASQTIADCTAVLRAVPYFRVDPAVIDRVDQTADRCLALIEGALSEIERASGSNCIGHPRPNPLVGRSASSDAVDLDQVPDDSEFGETPDPDRFTSDAALTVEARLADLASDGGEF